MDINEFDSLSGEDFEQALKVLLENQGFLNITYTPKTIDFGVDILAEKDGEKYGMQVKRSINSVGISAVQEVIGGVIYYGCQKGLIVTNSLLSDSAKELAKRANVGIIARDTLKAWIATLKISPDLVEIDPRPYQKEALLNLSVSRKNRNNKSLVIMASGLGKTYLSAFDVREFEQEIERPIRTLYLAHQGIILEQAQRSFQKIFGTKRTYGRFDGEEKTKGKDFTFATFQSLHISLEIFQPTEFDYIIVDEAHHSAADTRDAVINYFKPRFLLGLTATPNRPDGKDIFSYYENVALNLPLERALSENLLTPVEYRVYSDMVVASKLKKVLQNYDADDIDDDEAVFNPRPDREIVNLVLKTSKENFDTERTIVFCHSIEQMEHFSKLFKNSVSVSGRESRKEQVKRIDQFSSGVYSILLARDVLNEGIDIPSANLLVFLRNTESSVVFLQQLGRGLRITDDKDKVIVLDFVCNIERIRYVYSFYSVLRSFLRRQADLSQDQFHQQLNANQIIFDETARDVVEALISKKIEAGITSTLEKLTSSFEHKISASTLFKLVKHGELVPDYEIISKNGKNQYYFDSITIQRFVRRVFNVKETERFMHENAFSKQIKQPVAWLHKQEKWGRFNPSWVHRDVRGRVVFFYSEKDYVEVKSRLTSG